MMATYIHAYILGRAPKVITADSLKIRNQFSLVIFKKLKKISEVLEIAETSLKEEPEVILKRILKLNLSRIPRDTLRHP